MHDDILPWLSPQKRGRDYEKNRAVKRGGKARPGSGNQPGYKEDIRYSDSLEQVKTTNRSSFRIVAEDFLRTCKEAAKEGRVGQLAIIFLGAGPGGRDLKLVVREEEDWEP